MLVVGYNWRSFRNLGTQEAMDAAQVARNLSEGKGYTTLFVRPLAFISLRRAPRRNVERFFRNGRGRRQAHEMHPDLANPPVYPACSPRG
jgi:hypothetical protein